MKKVLVIGSGAREHALAWKLLLSSQINELIFSPGNVPAVEQLQALFPAKKVLHWPDSIQGAEALRSLAEKSKEAGVHFVVVGPDNALAEGAVDIFTELGLPAFGPTKRAAEVESSKIFSKRLMAAAGVPTAQFKDAASVEDAFKILHDLDWRNKHWVLKADGLALGKGVEICETLEQALQALQRLKVYSNHFVIEERLRGKEISWLAFCDGEICSLLPPAQDYKTLTEDPLSPNTGGMGSVCPVPIENPELLQKVRNEVFLPALKEMKRMGRPYKGVLYAGLMVHGDQLWVLEFNARFGDPEAQAILPLLNIDLLEWCEACVEGRLGELSEVVPTNGQSSVYVCAAAKGYPAAPVKGVDIKGLAGWIVPPQEFAAPRGFFAGIKKNTNGDYVTDGGRVLGVLGQGQTLADARAQAFLRLKEISFEGMQVREGVGSEWV